MTPKSLFFFSHSLQPPLEEVGREPFAEGAVGPRGALRGGLCFLYPQCVHILGTSHFPLTCPERKKNKNKNLTYFALNASPFILNAEYFLPLEQWDHYSPRCPATGLKGHVGVACAPHF